MTSIAECLKKLNIDVKHEDIILRGIAESSSKGDLNSYKAASRALRDALDDAVDERDDIIAQIEEQGGSVGKDPVKEVTKEPTPEPENTNKVLLSRAKPKEPELKNLLVAHNLTEENLKHVIELGGIAAPSLAITRKESEFTGYGDITLVASPDILNSPKFRTFDADVYSPRHPRALHDIDYKKYQSFILNLGDVQGLDTPSVDDLSDTNGLEAITRSPAVQYAWLRDNGKAPAVQSMKIDKQIQKLAVAMKAAGIKHDFLVMQDEKLSNMVNVYVDKRIAEYSQDREIDDDMVSYLSRAYKNDAITVANKYNESGGKDRNELAHDVAKKLRNPKTELEYKRYVLSKFNSLVAGKKIYKGFTPSGNRKYVPYNMDSILKEMTQTIRAGEGFNYGAGNIRAAFSKEFKSIKQIQDARDSIVSKADMENLKKESQDRVMDAIEELRPYYRYDANSFRYIDDASSAIAEGPRGWSEAFKMDADSRKIITDLVDYLTSLPTEYFEAKAKRAVGLNEFAAAVVPKGADQSVIDELKKAGIEVKYYKKGDNEARRKAVESVAESNNVLFAKRIHGDELTADDYVIPETPEFEGNMTGDLAYTPQSAVDKGIDQLPIRLRVGEARDLHKGYGIEHIAENAKNEPRRMPTKHTDDLAENLSRDIAQIAGSFTEAYSDQGRYILRLGKLNKAIIVESRSDDGDRFYSVVTLMPLFGDSAIRRYGKPVWSQGRLTFPNDRLLQSSVSRTPLGQESQQPKLQGRRNQTSKFHITTPKEKNQGTVVTYKKKRVVPIKRAIGFGGKDGLSKSDIQPLADKYNKRLTYGEVVVLNDESELPADVVPLKQVAWHGLLSAVSGKEESSSIQSNSNGVGSDSGNFRNFGAIHPIPKMKDKIIDGYGSPRLGREYSSTQKNQSNSLIADSKMLADFSESPSIIEHGFGYLDVPSKRMMFDAMSGVLENSEVRNIVIELVPVDMVNVLTDGKFSANVLFHDMPMLFDLLSVNGNKFVSPNVNVTSGLSAVIALAGAKFSILDAGRSSNKTSTAVITDEVDPLSSALDRTMKQLASVYPAFRNFESVVASSASSKSHNNIPFKDIDGNYNTAFNDEDVSITAKFSKELGNIEGAYVGNGKAYVVSNSINTMDRAKQVIEHELSHLAAEELLDSKEYSQAVKSVQFLEKSGNKVINEIAFQVDARQPGLDADTRSKEILAMSVETGKYRQASTLKRVVADLVRAFKRMLHRLGVNFKAVETMSEGEVFSVMRRAMDMLYDGSEPNAENKDSKALKSKSIKKETPDTLNIDGVDRPTRNSNGQLIHPTEDGIRNFWKWFGESEVTDKNGRPLVVYHATDNDFNEFDNKISDGLWFTDNIDSIESVGASGTSRRIAAYLKADNLQINGSNSDVESIREDGFDGIRNKYDYGSDYAVLDSNQIKSVSDNTGEFSSNNDDIRYSRSLPGSTTQQPEPFDPNTDIPETKFRKGQRFTQDAFNRFTVVKDWLKERGIELSEKADVYAAEERYHARVANQLEDFREKVRNPIIEKIAKAGFTLSDVSDFLEAQHTKEANAAIRKLTNEPDSTAYGITDDEADDYLKSASPELAKLSNELRDITEQSKKLRLKNGLLDKDEVLAWESTYKHYIPVKGDSEANKGTGKGLKVNFKTKRRLGHGKRDEAVIENILMDHERAIMQVEKNRVAKHLVMMAAEMGMPEIMTIGEPVKRKVLKNTTAYEVQVKGVTNGVFATKEAANMFKQLLPTLNKGISQSDIVINPTSDQRIVAMASPMLAENEVNAYFDGHAVRIQINDDLLARAYGKLGVTGFSAIVNAGRMLNGYLSKVYTGYNPEFIVTNLVRDFTSGVINLTGEEGIKMAAKTVGNYTKSFASLLKYASTGESDTWIDRYRNTGGNTGAAYLSDMERLGDEVKTEYASYQGVVSNLKQGDMANAARAAGRKAFNATLKWINVLNQAGENAMRLSAFRTMIESGRSPLEAASVAKNITVNFNRKGEFGAEANAAYLFFNASVQGTSALSHALFKGKHKYQAWALAGSMTTLGYMAAAALGGGDEDEYDRVNDYTKERNMLIKSGDGFIQIPVPYGYGFFWNLGRSIADAQRKGETGKLPWHIASSAIEELTPFSDTVVGNDGEFRSDQVLLGLAPTVFKIPAQPILNKQLFSGGELMPESPFKKFQPDREKMWRATQGTMFDHAAGWLETGLGMDVSPETLKHYTRTLTGGAGNMVDTSVSAAMLKSQGAELETSEIPFYRKAYTELTIRDHRAAYHKAADEAKKAAEEFSRAKEKGDLTSAKKIATDKGELLAFHEYANKLASVIDVIRSQQDAIRMSDTYTAPEKRLRVKELEAKEQKLYDQYLDVFKVKSINN